MASISWTLIEGFFPEMALVTDVTVQNAILAHVNTALDVSAFGGEDAPKTKLARVYLAAHLGFFSIPGEGGEAVAGPISAEATGGISRAYVFIQSILSQRIYSTTRYGQLYEQMLLTCPKLRIPRVFGAGCKRVR